LLRGGETLLRGLQSCLLLLLLHQHCSRRVHKACYRPWWCHAQSHL
jgi:hypothetical protein